MDELFDFVAWLKQKKVSRTFMRRLAPLILAYKYDKQRSVIRSD